MAQTGKWTTRGFEAFRQGTFGNGGQNLYVSRAGILQRIHHFDFDQDGYLDLVFSNSQGHLEMAPAGVYHDPLGKVEYQELLADGAWSGAVLDLNGDGCDDLVLGNWYNGIGLFMNAFIYYGGPEGWGERRHHRLPAPRCTSVAAGDFDGDGRPDLAFLTGDEVRLFYQSELGFEPKRFRDLAIKCYQMGSGDLDGDGCAELLVRAESGELTVYWGSTQGIDLDCCTVVPVAAAAIEEDASEEDRATAEYVQDARPLVKVIRLEGQPHVFVGDLRRALLVPAQPERQFGAPLVFGCRHALSVAAGDVNGDGHQDLVFACRQEVAGEEECSWVYWGSEAGFSEERRTALPSFRASDVAMGDLDGDGCDDIALCQGRTADSFTHVSLVYRGGREGCFGEPVRLATHDGRRVFIGRPSGKGAPVVAFVNTQARRKVEDVPVYIYPGGPDGFSPQRRLELPAWGAIGALGCDFNDDGWADLALVNSSHNTPSRNPGSYVYLNGPNGFPAQPTWRLPTDLAHGGCCADIDRDGRLELVFAGHRSPDILIFHGTTSGFDLEHPERIRMERQGVLYKTPLWLYLADLDNDGWLDLIVPQVGMDRSLILWGGPQGFSMERCQWLSVWAAACIRAADLTGNGYLDLIIGGGPPTLAAPHDSFVYIYWNGPEGLREDRRTLLPANDACSSVGVADFDNDGLMDIFVPSYTDSNTRDIDSFIYWNRPGRGFSAVDRTRLFTHSASGCVAADFNEDGWIDLAISNHKIEGDHLGWSGVWWNGPEGFSQSRMTRLPTSGPHGMMCVDPGNIADRGHEEFYVSAPFELPVGARLRRICWEAQTPARTWVKAQLRFAAAPEALAQAPWEGPDGAPGWFENGQQAQAGTLRGRWIQYRLALGAFNSGSTPRIAAVTVDYGREPAEMLPEAVRRNHYHQQDPGTVWSKDPGAVIDLDDPRDSYRVLTPNVIALPEGGYRMYYCGGSLERKEQGVTGYVVSAFSPDGIGWTREEGIRVDAHVPDAEQWVVCPEVIALPGGGYRMYFQARSAAERDTVLSALSTDGLNWTREEGIRFSSPQAHCGSPRCLPLEDGRFRLYCHEYPLPFRAGVGAGNHIISAISEDGLDFKREPGVRVEQESGLESYAVYAPEVLRLGDGSYRMYYAGWSAAPVEGRIFSATSEDGLNWKKERGVCLDRGGRFQEVKVSEPCVARLPDGRFRLFYEANDREGNWRILSATSS